jgi:hypothetical protein
MLHDARESQLAQPPRIGRFLNIRITIMSLNVFLGCSDIPLDIVAIVFVMRRGKYNLGF